MKGEDRASDPAPAVTSNHEPIVPRVCICVGCVNVVDKGRKFCSSECFGTSRRKQSEHEATIELLGEMQSALDQLRDHIKGAPA